MQTYTTRPGDMVDHIAFRHYGHHNGTSEAIYDANRGLAEQPAKLPGGLVINLPDLPADDMPQQTVKLYD